MLFFKLIPIAVSLSLITACQIMPEKSEQTENTVLNKEVVVEKEAVTKKEVETAINSNVLYLLLVGETALQRQQFEVAREAYLEASRRVSDTRVAERAAKIGLYLEELPKTEKAVSPWQSKDSIGHSTRQSALSSALHKKNQAALIKHLTLLLKQDPATFDAMLLDFGRVLKTPEDLKFVYHTLEVLAKKYPQQATVFLAQAILAVRQNNLELAKQKINQTLHLQPDWEKAIDFQAELFMYSGKMAFKNNQFEKAIAWFDQVKKGTLTFEAAIASVSVLFEQKNFAQALVRLEKLAGKTQDPKQEVRILVMQAELCNAQKDYQQAFDLLTKALDKNPEQRDLLYTRALTAEKLNDLKLFETDLQKILAQNPDDAVTLNALGYTLVDKTTRYDEAEQYLQKALQLEPDNAVIIDSYGWLEFKKGNLNSALKYLESAFKKMPENEIAAHLAETLWALGKQSEALKLFNQALKKTPTDEFLLDFQKRVLNNAPQN